MVKPGYKAVTLEEEVWKKAKRSIDEINAKAGVKRFRNLAHFIEEAVVSYAVEGFRKESDTPEEIMQKVVETVMNRKPLLRSVFRTLLDMPLENAVKLMQTVMTTEELEHLKRICARVKPREAQPTLGTPKAGRGKRGILGIGGKGPGSGPGKAHVLIDFGGKLLYLNKVAQTFMPNRKVGDQLFNGQGSPLTPESEQRGRAVIRRVLETKETFHGRVPLTFKDGRRIVFDGFSHLVPAGNGEKVFEVFFTPVQDAVRKVPNGT